MRKATERDLPAIVTIEIATQLAPWSAEIFERCIQSHDCWVVEENQQVIGFIIMSCALTGESHILNLCVDPLYQHKGFGRQLLNHAISQAQQKGMEMMYLEVRCSNQAAIQLYQKMDFIQIGERKNYYPLAAEFEDALVFARELKM